MTRRIAIVAAVVLVLGVAGCGSSEGQEPSTGSSPAAAASSASPTPPPPPSPTLRSLDTEAKARELLLTSDDLGPGWQSDRADAPGEQRTSNQACSRVERDLYNKGSADLVVTVGWAFYGAAQAEHIDHIVKAYPDQGRAAGEIAQVRESVSRCRTWQAGGVAPSYAFTMSMEPATVPQVGDEAVAWRYSAKTSLAPDVATTYSVLLRVGVVTSLVRYTPGTLMPSSAAEKHLRELVVAAVARAEKASQLAR